MSVTLNHVSAWAQKAALKLAAEQRKPTPFVSLAGESRDNLPDDARESEIQAACEAWLIRRGYGRRATKTLQAHESGKWFLHFPQARGNPIVLDLLILDAARSRYLEVELKTATGQLTPDQNAIIVRGNGVLCRSFEQFRDAVTLWETSITTPPRC